MSTQIFRTEHFEEELGKARKYVLQMLAALQRSSLNPLKRKKKNHVDSELDVVNDCSFDYRIVFAPLINHDKEPFFHASE